MTNIYIYILLKSLFNELHFATKIKFIGGREVKL